jgi:polysaccharide pyruvyl transferase WcaK-like protein
VREWTDDLLDVVSCVRGAECVIAMRLHAAILSVALERNCVLMPYDHKVREFGLQIGSRSVIEPETLDSVAAIDEVLEGSFTRPSTWENAPLPAAWDAIRLLDPPDASRQSTSVA